MRNWGREETLSGNPGATVPLADNTTGPGLAQTRPRPRTYDTGPGLTRDRGRSVSG